MYASRVSFVLLQIARVGHLWLPVAACLGAVVLTIVLLAAPALSAGSATRRPVSGPETCVPSRAATAVDCYRPPVDDAVKAAVALVRSNPRLACLVVVERRPGVLATAQALAVAAGLSLAVRLDATTITIKFTSDRAPARSSVRAT